MDFKHFRGAFGIIDHCAERRGHAAPVPFLASERVADHIFDAGFFLGIDIGVPLGKTSPRAFLDIRIVS